MIAAARQLRLPGMPPPPPRRPVVVVVRTDVPAPWVKIDDGLPGNRKWQRLSSPACRLWIEALCWAGQHLTDGALPRENAAGIAFAIALRDGGDGAGWKALVDELVDAGLWEAGPDGWQIHDFLEYNPSCGQVVQARAATRERVAAFRARTVTNAVSNAVTNGASNASPGPGPDPDPSPSPPPSAAAAARDDERDGYLGIVWECFAARLPSPRRPSPRELAVVERWRVSGVDADFVAGLMAEEPAAVRTLLWFAEKVIEAWEGHCIESQRADLLGRLQRLYGRLAAEVALDLAEGIEGADSSEQLRELESRVATAEGSTS